MKYNKYRNKKVTVDGIKFDSQKEAWYYVALKSKKQNKEIKDFELQVKIELMPKFKYQGETVRAITYYCDFLIYHNDGTKEYVDVKGVQTDVFKIKWKMFKLKLVDTEGVKLTLV